MPYFSHKDSFKAVEKLASAWDTGKYVYHIKMDRDNGVSGIDYTVLFSMPTPETPVPKVVAHVSVTVIPPPPDDSKPRILFKLLREP